jgi:hypothetical protein
MAGSPAVQRHMAQPNRVHGSMASGAAWAPSGLSMIAGTQLCGHRLGQAGDAAAGTLFCARQGWVRRSGCAPLHHDCERGGALSLTTTTPRTKYNTASRRSPATSPDAPAVYHQDAPLVLLVSSITAARHSPPPLPTPLLTHSRAAARPAVIRALSPASD